MSFSSELDLGMGMESPFSSYTSDVCEENLFDIDLNDLVPGISDNIFNMITKEVITSPPTTPSSFSSSLSSSVSSSSQMSPGLIPSSPWPVDTVDLPDTNKILIESKTPYTDATNCKKKSTNGHIKRPMNSFMIFAQRERLRISTMSEKPLHNAVISKMCGAKWRLMTAEEKKPYEDLAQDYKMRHSVQFPFYVYKPKKKEATAKKAKKNKEKKLKKLKNDIPKVQKPKVTKTKPALSTFTEPVMRSIKASPEPTTADNSYKIAKISSFKASNNSSLKINNCLVPADPPLSPFEDFLNVHQCPDVNFSSLFNQDPGMKTEEVEMEMFPTLSLVENQNDFVNNWESFFQLQTSAHQPSPHQPLPFLIYIKNAEGQ